MKKFSLIEFIFDKLRIQTILKKLNIKNLDLPLNSLTKTLELQKNNISNFIKIIHKYELDTTINEFNMLIYLNFFPEIIIFKKNDISNKLTNCVNKTINILINYNMYNPISLFKIYISMKSFTQIFRNWIDDDITDYVTNLTLKYIQTEDIINEYESIDNLYDDEIDNVLKLKKMQNNILNKIIDVNGINIVNNLTPTKLYIEKNKKKEYDWNQLENELKKIPINYNITKMILMEINEIIYKILNNRYDILTEVEKNFDIANIINDSHNILQITNYLFDLLFKIQSKKYDEITIVFHKDLKQSMINGQQLFTFLPNTLKFLINSYYVVLYEKNIIVNSFNKLIKK